MLITKKQSIPRIGLDLHVVGAIHQGSRTHCLELFSRVVSLDSKLHFIVFVPEPQTLLKAYPTFGSSNVELVPTPRKSAPIRLLKQLPMLATEHRIDLMHLQYVTPPFCPCATAVTIHDVLFESHAQFFKRWFTFRSKILIRRSAYKSRLVFTVSDFSRNEIIARYGLKAERVTTILNGVDLTRFRPGNEGAPLIRQLGLSPGEYLLTVGRLEPRKNHVGLLRAYSRLSKPRPRLVIVGQLDFDYADVLDLVKNLGLKDDILMLHNIEDDMLPIIYRHALCFIYPTWAEGFGMPVVEAMASGIPVITSNNTSIPEVSGGAALLVSPGDANSITQAIVQVLNDTEGRRELIARGLVRAEQLGWDGPAATVSDAYERHFHH